MTIRDLLLARAEQDTPALLTHERTWTWRELVADASARAAALRRALDPERPPHVGLLMDNTAEMLLGLAAAGLGGHVAVGINSTRRGDAIVADLERADVQVLLTDATQRHLLDGLDLSGIRVIDTDAPDWAGAEKVLEPVERTPTKASLFMLIFTSGTSGRPKAVRITHEKVTYPGAYLSERFGLTAHDVHYVAMPLFHSNAVMAGWAPALVTGAAVALREKFSASEFLSDIRRFGATYASYVGKPLTYVLATPERPDDADNPLRLVFGNEAGDRDIRAFGERFGCVVVDGFGSTENAVIVSRIEGTPAGALGWPGEGVAVLDPETGVECPRAELDEDGQVLNLDECVGELVNTTGAGQFAGYYNDDEATAERMRGGMYWSGDLAYRDAEGWVWFAGRTAAWLRVDGENLACAPIERILLRHPAIDQAAVYAVPDERSGDQVAAALVLRGELGPDDFAWFLDEQADLSPKARPRYVRLVDDLPRTATHKVLHRELTAAGTTDVTWTREERGTAYA
ncbi:acyl-CoA synthetase [Aeromicrobium sp. Root344]|uniref:AMP-binding protein n=1 Tax=Aeromicrobium sp. Root344 TaxID=1736521 RepID=UPI0006FA5249|nr:AMP-binding protein [Aeromicrobium sp. Root344]KQV74512.1 acyl-CoA synthetase [Aeromicrobium sp. Root344]